MIKIVKASTLAALRSQAALACELSERIAEADEQRHADMADSLRARQAHAEAQDELAALRNQAAGRRQGTEDQASEGQAAWCKLSDCPYRYDAHGHLDPDLMTGPGLREYARLGLLNLTTRTSLSNRARATIEGSSPECAPCPMPYYPGGPVPCVAARRCMRPSQEQDMVTAGDLRVALPGES